MFKKITIPLAVIIAITIFGIYASKTKTNRTVYAGVVKGHIALLDPETGSVQDSFPELSVNRILDYFDRESFLVAVSKKPSEYFNPGGDVYDIYKLNLKTREKELLLGSASQAYLSPTREQLAYVQNRTLKILDLKSGESEEVAREIIFYPGFPKPWSPDGQKLAYTLEIPANKARNYVYDLTTKNYLALIPEDEEAHPYVLSWDQQKKIITVYNPESEKDTVKIVKIGLDGTKEVVLELPTTGAPTIEDISNNLLLIRYSETNSLTLFDLSKKDGDPKKVLTINDPNYRVFANILPNGNVFFKEIRLEETEGGLKEHRVRTGLWRKSDEQLITLPEDVESIKTLFSGTVNAGTEKSVTWDGKNSSGAIVGNGQYYFYIYSQTGSYALTKVSIHGSTGPAFMYNPFNWHNYWNITAYFDRDPNAGTAKDYRNGTATVYDGHKGTDFSTGGTTGKPLYAAMSGTVIRSRYDTLAGYYVAVKDSNNRIVMYQHMLEGGRPAEGTNVAAGQQVGYSGNTGQSTGPHLHIRYEVNNVWTTPYDIYNSSYSLLIQDPRPTGYYSATLTP